VTLVFLFHGLLVGAISHSSSPATPHISSTVAMLEFGRTSVVRQEKRLDKCYFSGKVMDISYSFGTRIFSLSVISGTSTVFQASGLLDCLLGGMTTQ
jgi:hypothetical protein